METWRFTGLPAKNLITYLGFNCYTWRYLTINISDLGSFINNAAPQTDFIVLVICRETHGNLGYWHLKFEQGEKMGKEGN